MADTYTYTTPPDYDTNLATIAGRIAAGMATQPYARTDAIARLSVTIARQIIERINPSTASIRSFSTEIDVDDNGVVSMRVIGLPVYAAANNIPEAAQLLESTLRAYLVEHPEARQ